MLDDDDSQLDDGELGLDLGGLTAAGAGGSDLAAALLSSQSELVTLQLLMKINKSSKVTRINWILDFLFNFPSNSIYLFYKICIQHFRPHRSYQERI